MSKEQEKPMKKKSSDEKESSKQPPLLAKKDFHIVHNDYEREIKAGEDISDVPEKYFENLKTEKII